MWLVGWFELPDQMRARFCRFCLKIPSWTAESVLAVAFVSYTHTQQSGGKVQQNRERNTMVSVISMKIITWAYDNGGKVDVETSML